MIMDMFFCIKAKEPKNQGNTLMLQNNTFG